MAGGTRAGDRHRSCPWKSRSARACRAADLAVSMANIVLYGQQWRGPPARMRRRLVFIHPEEVSMSFSSFIKGLLIAENAG